MRFAILFLALTALACTKKEEAPSEAEPSATETPTEPEAQAPDTDTPEVFDAAQKQRMAEEAEKLGKELAAELANADENLPEALQGETPEVGKPPTIELVEAGEKPRKPLRFDIAPGFEQKEKLDVGMTNTAVVVMLSVGNPEYVVQFDLSVRATEPQEGGAVPVAFEVNDAQIDPKTFGDDEKRVKGLTEALESARKLEGRYTLGPRGGVIDFQVDVPEGANKHAEDMADNLRLAIMALTPAFPDEPVGPGAKWTVHQAIEQANAVLNQLTTYALASREGDTAELKVTVRQTAARQPWESQDTKYEIETFKGVMDGKLTWSAKKLLPAAADFDSEVIKGLRYEAKDRPQAVGVAVKVDRTIDIGANE